MGFELAVKAQEEHVGPFRADILCEEPDTGKLVLVENQLERTDHSHLGQILTYAAGLETVSIIWIAEHFTEEHRADWLNRITDSEFNFFGVEISVIKIDAPAPIFTIVAKPNDWSKEAHKVSQAVNSDTKLAQKEVWRAFSEYMEANPSKLFHLQRPQPQGWTTIHIGTSIAKLELTISSQKQKVGVRLEVEAEPDKR